ncbi:MAG: flagellar hook-associated family protein [Hyphomicrobium sp.]|nr:flagellar hook-associated family protein [Hyphomicrobium sp.]
MTTMIGSLTTVTSAGHALAAHIRRGQSEAARIESEIASGRIADVGRVLGSETSRLVGLRQEATALAAAIDANATVKSRFEASQAALAGIAETAGAVLSTLMAARNDPDLRAGLEFEVGTAMRALQDLTNTTFAGRHLFSGIATTTPPMPDYFSDPQPRSRMAVSAAFQSAFGMTNADPAAASIDASSMQAFLDTGFEALFADPAWGSDWTAASPEPLTSLIAADQKSSTSLTAHDTAFRKITAAFTMVLDTGAGNLNEAAFGVVADAAIAKLSEGVASLAESRGRLGSVEADVVRATERMERQVDVMRGYIADSERVDLPALSVTLNALLTRLEATFAVTARMRSISLLDAL